jgi:hypothetical protein
MTVENIFRIQLIAGYIVWLICLRTWFWPRFKAMDRVNAQRAIATLHSFRFFGLVFIVPGVVGANLPPGFATYAAYGDFATGVLAMLALMAFRSRQLFLPLVILFNLVGTADILIDYYHGNQLGLPALAGQLGGVYWVPVIYVPLLMITHIAAFRLLLSQPKLIGTNA